MRFQDAGGAVLPQDMLAGQMLLLLRVWNGLEPISKGVAANTNGNRASRVAGNGIL